METTKLKRAPIVVITMLAASTSHATGCNDLMAYAIHNLDDVYQSAVAFKEMKSDHRLTTSELLGGLKNHLIKTALANRKFAWATREFRKAGCPNTRAFDGVDAKQIDEEAAMQEEYALILERAESARR